MTATKKKIKVLIVDDHPVVRKGLWSCLDGRPNLKIVGEATNGHEALKQITALQPDVTLMDISMPEMDGLQVTEKLHKDMPELKVLVLSVSTNRETVLRIIRAGARGYVLKESSPEDLVKAIELVNAGEAFFSPPVARIALNQYVSELDESDPASRLSDREREVLVLIASGRSNKEIASDLGIGVRTIETHRERIMRKLTIRSVAGLTKFAIANGLVALDDGPKR